MTMFQETAMCRTIRRPLSIVALAVCLAGVVAGCRGGTERVVASGAGAADDATTTSAAPSTTVAAATSTTARPAGTAATTTTARRATTTTARPPKVVAANQGDRVVAVFVATGAALTDPSFTRARSRLATLGYRGFSGGDTGCSQGAKEALPQLQAYSLSLEFATSAEAARFAALYGQVIGTATVTIFCAD